MVAHGTDGRALLVGSPGRNLQGVEWDVHAMAAMLRKRCFAVSVLFGTDATRDSILAGYDTLIQDVRLDEPAVFYYAGHGFFACPETEPGRSWQGIYPSDKDATTTDDFRGITAWELSIKQAQLTARTKNVTTILDCCYASQMSRAAAAHGAIARALPHPVRKGFTSHLEALRAKYPAVFDTFGSVGNVNATRLVACGQSECAYEYRGSDGQYRGVFTEALLQVLGEVDVVPVSWAAIIASIQARVTRRFSIQHPGIEGPRRRRLFSLEEDDGSRAVPILVAADEFRLLAPCVTRVSTGDIYGVMPSGSPVYRPDSAIAEVEISSTSGTFATAALRSWKNGQSTLPHGAIAFPIEKRAVQHAVTIDTSDCARTIVEQAVNQAAALRLARPGEVVTLPILRVNGDAITIEDRIGPLFPRAHFPDDLHAVLQNLANLGAAEDLREFEGQHGVSANELDVELGTVDRGERRPLPNHGSSLALGDTMYVRVVNRAQRPLYIHVFNIGLRGKITSLTPDAHTGIRLTSEQPEFVLGRTPEGAIVGYSLEWPPGMPRDTPRIDEIVVIATEMVTSLQVLETVEQTMVEPGDDAPLRRAIVRQRTGGNVETRDARAFDGFLVKRLTYLLHPRDAIMADLPFTIDDNPLRQGAIHRSEVWGTQRGDEPDESRSASFTARLTNFIIRDTASLTSRIRIDLLATTRSESAVRYTTLTRKCHEVSAGQPLELGDDLALCDVARDFVEFHLWISADAGHPDLTQLLAHWHEENAVTLCSDAAAAANTAVSAASAAAILARAAYGVLRDTGGPTFGVYRTCMTTHQGVDEIGPLCVGAYETPEVAFTASIAIGKASNCRV